MLGDKRFLESAESSSRKSRRLSSPEPEQSRGLFSNDCQICGKYRIQRRNKKYTPYNITSHAATVAIKNAAESKDPMHFCEIKDIDLIAKEYKVHQPCYQTFTKGFSQSNTEVCSSSSSSQNVNQEQSNRSNFNEVIEYVRDVIIGDQCATSMKILHNIYGIGLGKFKLFKVFVYHK